jgi:hypothetical protein
MPRAHPSAALLVRGLFLLARLLPATLLLTTLSLALILATLLLAALIVLVHLFPPTYSRRRATLQSTQPFRTSIHCELFAHGNFLSNFPV